jgi:putative MATE family efflux protein
VDPLAGGSVRLHVLRLGVPQAVGLCSHALINLVDLLLIGRLGAGAVAAAHVATIVNFVPMIVGNGIATASMALLSRSLGAGDRAGAIARNRRCQLFMIWFGALVSIATALPAGPCVDLTGLEGKVRDDAVLYLTICNLGCLPMFALMQTTAAMRALGETTVPLGLLLLANLLNLALDLVLMFGWDAIGVPAYGVVGGAYGTLASRAVAALLGYAWLLSRDHPLSLRGPHVRVPGVACFLLNDAWPQVAQIALRAVLVYGLTVVVQRVEGVDAVTALGITTRLDTMVLFAAMGFAGAATAIAGRAAAVGDVARVRAAAHAAGLQAALFGLLLVIGFCLLAEPLVTLFVPGAGRSVIDVARLYLASAAFAHPFSAYALGAVGAVNGTGEMRAPLVVDLIGFAGLAAAVTLAILCGGGLLAVFAAIAAGMAFVAGCHAWHARRGRWAEVRSRRLSL